MDAARRTRWTGGVAAAGTLLLVGACHVLSGLDGFEITEGNQASGVGGGGADAASGGAGGNGAGAGGSGGGLGGAGGGEPCAAQDGKRDCYTGYPGTEGVGICKGGTQHCLEDGYWGPCEGEVVPDTETDEPTRDKDCGGTALVDRALLARYFINEAATGTAPAVLRDSAPGPVDLALDYGSNLSFIEAWTNRRGLSWADMNSAGRASASVPGTKLQDALAGARVLTLEAVVDIASISNDIPRLFSLDVGTSERLGLSFLTTPTRVRLSMNEQEASTWPLSFPTGRAVIHVILNTSDPDPAERWKLYLNGQLFPGTRPNPPLPEGTLVDLSQAATMLVGNTVANNGSFRGHLFYLALYVTVFSGLEVELNTGLLLDNDDDWRTPTLGGP
ncbi:hypothetical protein [Chondromyces crocatus]|uniref:Uncharacterized protein n=1 Tax=Chondromyces crocatus TaxID=52 RepID=A0A0K1EGU3_CHOCO|nr:hypothetical protein [Chondromyces crocatus]AKT40075.1 uncharacterized protein CMC5_042280 [Chondromyces crocatus]